MKLIYDNLNSERVFKVPTSWDDVTIKQYIELTSFYLLYKDNPKDFDINQSMAVIAEILCEIPREDFENLEYQNVIKLKTFFKFLEKDINFDKRNLMSKIKFKNYEIRVKEFENLTFAEFADTQTFVEKNNIVGAISKLIDIYEAPDWKRFRFKSRNLKLNQKTKMQFIEEIPAKMILNLFFFSTSLMKTLDNNTAHYFNKLALHQNIKNVFLSIGVGWFILRYYLKMMLQNLKK